MYLLFNLITYVDLLCVGLIKFVLSWKKIIESDISIDEEATFGIDYAYPINILQVPTRTALSEFLNPENCIPTGEGISRDWEGLLAITGNPGSFFHNIRGSSDPTQELLAYWLYKQNENATIDKMLSHFKVMDRYDILEDILPYIVRDINLYKFQKQNEILTPPFEILTIDDALRWSQGLGPQFYDAFILFSEADIKFAEELVHTLENTYNLKLCVADRNLEAGVLVHENILKLTADRCRKLIVVLSTELFENPVNLFFCNFGVKIGLERKEDKLIGIIYKECSIPKDLDLHFLLDKDRISKYVNFWEKLHKHIVPVELNNCNGLQKVPTKKINFPNRIVNVVSRIFGKTRRRNKEKIV